jgi:hypothetical protein
MLEILNLPGQPSRRLGRRAMLQTGGAGLLGVSMNRLLAAEEVVAPAGPRPRAKSVIFLFLFGGPSQYETFDMKPDSPADIRGPMSPIGCRTPGLRICEHLPRLADISDRFCVIRSMTHKFSNHIAGTYITLTGSNNQRDQDREHDHPEGGEELPFIARERVDDDGGGVVAVAVGVGGGGWWWVVLWGVGGSGGGVTVGGGQHTAAQQPQQQPPSHTPHTRSPCMRMQLPCCCRRQCH